MATSRHHASNREPSSCKQPANSRYIHYSGAHLSSVKSGPRPVCLRWLVNNLRVPVFFYSFIIKKLLQDFDWTEAMPASARSLGTHVCTNEWSTLLPLMLLKAWQSSSRSSCKVWHLTSV